MRSGQLPGGEEVRELPGGLLRGVVELAEVEAGRWRVGASTLEAEMGEDLPRYLLLELAEFQMDSKGATLRGKLSVRSSPHSYEVFQVDCPLQPTGASSAAGILDAPVVEEASLRDVVLVSFDELVTGDGLAAHSSSVAQLGVQPLAFADTGYVWGVKIKPNWWPPGEHVVSVSGGRDAAGHPLVATLSVRVPPFPQVPAMSNLGFEQGQLSGWFPISGHPERLSYASNLGAWPESSPYVYPVEGQNFALVSDRSLRGTRIVGALVKPPAMTKLSLQVGLVNQGVGGVDYLLHAQPEAKGMMIRAYWDGGEKTLATVGQLATVVPVSDEWTGWHLLSLDIASLPQNFYLELRNAKAAPPVATPLLLVDDLQFQP